jgi:hypothetical protein
VVPQGELPSLVVLRTCMVWFNLACVRLFVWFGLQRRLAGSIAFGGGPQEAAPVIDGPQCYEGENCVATDRPTGARHI